MAGRTILFFADASSGHTKNWVREIAARGYDCVLATRRPAAVPGAREVIALRPGGDAIGWFLAIPELQRIARRIKPHWLHGHYVTSYGLWAAACSTAHPAPLVLTAWGSDLLVTPRAPGLRGAAMAALVRWTLRRAALVTADSRDMLAEVRRYGARARCEEVLWGADTERMRPAARPAPGFEIASLRNWEPNYNIDTLLRAFARLRAQRPQAQALLHLLGGGPGETALRALAAELGVAEAVRFTGRVDEAAMLAALQRVRVSVSVPSSDATSVSLLESMACGLPVVGSDLPSNRQWLDAALIVPVRDPEALAALLVRLHDDADLARAQGLRNRELAVRRASRRAQMDRMAVLYDSLRIKAPAAP